jgi:hypothetical protein
VIALKGMTRASRVTSDGRGKSCNRRDGHRAYAEAVEGAFGMDVDYAMMDHIWSVEELVTLLEGKTVAAAA